LRPIQQYQMEMQPLSRPYNSGQYNNYYDEEEDSDYDEADAGPKKRNGACSPLVCLGIGCGGCCCCMILVLLIVGIVGGFLFVKAPRKWGWMEGVSACNKYWCSLSDGPFLTPQNITKYLRWAGVPAAQIVGLKSDALLNTSGPNCYPAIWFPTWILTTQLWTGRLSHSIHELFLEATQSWCSSKLGGCQLTLQEGRRLPPSWFSMAWAPATMAECPSIQRTCCGPWVLTCLLLASATTGSQAKAIKKNTRPGDMSILTTF